MNAALGGIEFWYENKKLKKKSVKLKKIKTISTICVVVEAMCGASTVCFRILR